MKAQVKAGFFLNPEAAEEDLKGLHQRAAARQCTGKMLDAVHNIIARAEATTCWPENGNLADAIKSFPTAFQPMLRFRFGLPPSQKPHTLKHTAAHFRVSREEIRERERHLLELLRHKAWPRT